MSLLRSQQWLSVLLCARVQELCLHPLDLCLLMLTVMIEADHEKVYDLMDDLLEADVVVYDVQERIERGGV